jgi:hypothetical protein
LDGNVRTSTLLCDLQKIGKRGYFCVLMKEVGVRLSSPPSDTSRPEGADDGILEEGRGGGGVQPTC